MIRVRAQRAKRVGFRDSPARRTIACRAHRHPSAASPVADRVASRVADRVTVAILNVLPVGVRNPDSCSDQPGSIDRCGLSSTSPSTSSSPSSSAPAGVAITTAPRTSRWGSAPSSASRSRSRSAWLGPQPSQEAGRADDLEPHPGHSRRSQRDGRTSTLMWAARGRPSRRRQADDGSARKRSARRSCRAPTMPRRDADCHPTTPRSATCAAGRRRRSAARRSSSSGRTRRLPACRGPTGAPVMSPEALVSAGAPDPRFIAPGRHRGRPPEAPGRPARGSKAPDNLPVDVPQRTG